MNRTKSRLAGVSIATMLFVSVLFGPLVTASAASGFILYGSMGLLSGGAPGTHYMNVYDQVAFIVDGTPNQLWIEGDTVGFELATPVTFEVGTYELKDSGVNRFSGRLLHAGSSYDILSGSIAIAAIERDVSSRPTVLAMTLDVTTVASGSFVGGVMIGVADTGSLGGTVRVDDSGVSAATVRLYAGFSTTAAATATTASNGAYSFTDLPSGAYRLEISGAGLPAQWLGGHATRLLSPFVGVFGAATSRSANAFDGSAITGVASASATTGLNDAEWLVFDESVEIAAEGKLTQVTETGITSFVYEATGLPRGEYRALVLPTQQGDLAWAFHPAANSFRRAGAIEVAGNTVQADVALTPAATIFIEVGAPRQEFVTYNYEELWDDDFDFSIVQEDLPGGPGFRVPAGTYHAWGANYDPVEDLFWDYFPEWYDGAPWHQLEGARDVTVKAGSVTTVRITLDPFFDDMFDTVFSDDIFWMQATGITTGCGEAGYCPGDDVTRGQMAAFLVRALGLTESDANIEFSDDDNSVFEADIERLATAGITSGCGDGIFCPNDPVTRGQMAAFLVRAMGYTDSGDTDFTDDNNSVFEADIERLAAAGVTTGCGPTTFCPNDNVTRGQMAAFLRRALDN